MVMEEIISAVFLLAVLFLVMPAFLSTNNKVKQFVQNVFIWAIIVFIIVVIIYLLYNEKNQFSYNWLFRKNGTTTHKSSKNNKNFNLVSLTENKKSFKKNLWDL